MSGERDINYLLNLYENQYVTGEKRSNESQKKIRHEIKRKNRHLILDELLQEAYPLTLNKNQIQLVRYLIDDFNKDFKTLHRKTSEECIILSFIFYTKKIETPSIRLEDYKIFNKYQLTDHIFEIILCRMLLKFMNKMRIKPRETTKDNHDILVREGIR